MNCTRRLLALAGLALVGPVLSSAQTPVPAVVANPAAGATAPASAADKDFEAFNALRRPTPPAGAKDMTREQRTRWSEESQQKIIAAGLAFYEKYPQDPRRWQVVQALGQVSPQFVKEYGPDYEKPNTKPAVIDEAAANAWKTKVADLKSAMAKATDVPLDVQEGAAWMDFAKDFRATTAAKRAGQPFDYAPFHARFDAHVAKFGSLSNMGARASDYLGALESNMPGAGVTEWKYLQASSPNAALRTYAGEALAKRERDAAAKADLESKPLDIAFTAVDGRKVDLKDLRGKVVLVDFWATWCGPCIAELPNVKKVYAAYHAKGFEIVGIALENASLLPKDTPEQTAAKMAKAAKVLTDFTAKEEMPWPQYFDGKYWKNDISTRFDIRGIPAMFLVDQNGKVVSTNARGELLEKEVKRLLKL